MKYRLVVINTTPKKKTVSIFTLLEFGRINQIFVSGTIICHMKARTERRKTHRIDFHLLPFLVRRSTAWIIGRINLDLDFDQHIHEESDVDAIFHIFKFFLRPVSRDDDDSRIESQSNLVLHVSFICGHPWLIPVWESSQRFRQLQQLENKPIRGCSTLQEALKKSILNAKHPYILLCSQCV